MHTPNHIPDGFIGRPKLLTDQKDKLNFKGRTLSPAVLGKFKLIGSGRKVRARWKGRVHRFQRE